MRILFFIEGLASGGKERRLVELIKGLSKYSDIEMELVLYKDIIHYKDIFSTKTKIHYLLRGNAIRDLSIFIKFYNVTRNFRPDIIHVWGKLPAIYAIPTKVILKLPLINNQITNAPSKVSNSILGHKLTFPFSDKIISNTYAGLESYNAPKSKRQVIYNGFDFNRINNLKDENLIRQEFKINTKFIVGMVASSSIKKDYKTFIDAANIILEKENNITFLCIGKGDFSRFEDMVKLKNKDKILFLGNQNQVESIMNICDIGVLITCKKHGEGISNAILEFSALGKPVIATLGGGTKEIIDNGTTGFLINNLSEELVKKILHFYNNMNDLKYFGERSKKVVVEKFNISKMIDKFRNVYNEVLN